MLLKLAGAPQTRVSNIPTAGDKPKACAGRLKERVLRRFRSMRRGNRRVAASARTICKITSQKEQLVMLKGMAITTDG
jgi:hypothetical protein